MLTELLDLLDPAGSVGRDEFLKEAEIRAAVGSECLWEQLEHVLSAKTVCEVSIRSVNTRAA